MREHAAFYSPTAVTNALQELHAALETMQTEYFSLWLGKWTTAIDWTAAVMGTHVSATLSSLSHSLTYTMPGTFDKTRKLDVEAQMIENEINKYFSHIITYYFGEDHFAIRNQAYDDILWVVLGWLESVQFIDSHSDSHYPPSGENGDGEWYARQFIPAFAHRARVFYELAEKGWDWRLCGGGLTWNPRLLPYKNAITNELFISASIDMYLYFPGDDNCSPFLGAKDQAHPDWKRLHAQEQRDPAACPDGTPASPTYDPIYLANAINGYDWLKNVGMTNDQGLYVDGFHIKDYYRNHSKTECDDRNEMVYTYNQGVILSGLRGLWEATGNITYLEDGHELIRNVIHATGWTDTDIAPTVSLTTPSKHENPARNPYLFPVPAGGWAGLGAHGILTELCDPFGTCSQNGHTFKGIFFHHLTTFCTPLPLVPVRRGKTFGASPATGKLHHQSCNEYAPWVVHNAQAALKTRDSKGKFGTWWGAEADPDARRKAEWPPEANPLIPGDAFDYRNSLSDVSDPGTGEEFIFQPLSPRNVHITSDLNDRGRGRTVETQGGGVAVVRAMWEFLRRYEGGDDL